ncbi:hypothetical protein PV05_03163 [Exophiala xenobiotica]|uniref:Uncharacterized protein n=1 Tax=Exophiala xenobiotica TaxID=348802 RepID=A0A0D2ESG6_9EURO|nr:uncharacterized protein PV05_03163 [Exophiala xenobiotica]KIW58663.1 hypothetical protein PV05_03163 [Exophiala xenobiotica]
MAATAPTSATATLKDVVQPRVTFLDLPQEVRLMIYRHLFKDQPIIIQGEDCYKPSSHGNWCVVSRDRAMGLNILLTCKSCLCEAKPVLLNTAKFDIYFGSIGSLESPQLQGFSRHELSMVRSVTLRRVNLWRGPVNMLLSIMKNLVKVTIFYGHLDFHYWRLERWISGSVITIPRAIRDIWKYDMHKMFLPHMKKKVETQADATLKLEYRAEFYDRTEAVIHADLLEQQVWVTEANSGSKILMEPRSVPKLVAHLETLASPHEPTGSARMEEIQRQ